MESILVDFTTSIPCFDCSFKMYIKRNISVFIFAQSTNRREYVCYFLSSAYVSKELHIPLCFCLLCLFYK